MLLKIQGEGRTLQPVPATRMLQTEERYGHGCIMENMRLGAFQDLLKMAC
jgi:hypothetical protein